MHVFFLFFLNFLFFIVYAVITETQLHVPVYVDSMYTVVVNSSVLQFLFHLTESKLVSGQLLHKLSRRFVPATFQMGFQHQKHFRPMANYVFISC